jgi:hypothetical protein
MVNTPNGAVAGAEPPWPKNVSGPSDTAGPLGRPLPGDPMRYCPGCRRPVPPPRTHCGPCLARAWVRGS